MNETVIIAHLTREYLSKVKCCDECFCETYCICNGLKKTRYPHEGCEWNIIDYFYNRSYDEEYDRESE